MNSDAGITLEADAPGGKRCRVRLEGRTVRTGYGPVARGIRLYLVVVGGGQMRSARKLERKLSRAGFKVKVVRRRSQEAKPEPASAVAERPYCPKCRERDKVVIPSDPLPERKAWPEPYCLRCNGRLRTLPKHKLPPPEFD